LYNQHENFTPFVSKLRRQGFTFKNAFINFTPSATGPALASIGTGTVPKYHGIMSNKIYLPSIDKKVSVFETEAGIDTSQLTRPSIGDIWDIISDNKAHVISYGTVARAAIGLGGHGSQYNGGDKDIVFWFDSKSKKFATDGRIFEYPLILETVRWEEMKNLNNEDPYWSKQSCHYPKDEPYASCFAGSPAFAAMEGKALLEVLKSQHEIGKDEITDLIFINFNGADYCGHFMGSESLECRSTLAQINIEMESIYNELNARTNHELVTFVTADHGIAPLPRLSGGKMVNGEDLIKDLMKQFDHKSNNRNVIKAVEPTFINVDLQELTNNGFTLKDIKRYLLSYKVDGQPFFERVYTLDQL
jgi:predicted AlkP superfamily pyrophosphatase or phosphodiesterase